MISNKSNRIGFTLAELLIVVAIIGVLVAISIPVFTSQLERSREATDLANIRAAYAEACQNALTTSDGTASAYTVPMVQKDAGWHYLSATIGQNYDIADNHGNPINPLSGDIIKVIINDDITITFATQEEISD